MKRLLFIFAIFPAMLLGQNPGHQIDRVQNQFGQGVPNPSVRVCTEPAVGSPCSNLATIYTCNAINGSCIGPNPLTGDQYGNYNFFAPNNVPYHLEFIGPSLIVPDIEYYVYLPGLGGGGGGAVPCGVLYDVQINDPGGTFGCDTGVFQENPTTHVVMDTFVQATQQLQTGSAGFTGTLLFNHSNGSSINASLILGLDSTFSTSYGLDFPDTAALGALTITSLTPGVDGRLPTAWVPSSGGGGSPCGGIYDVQINDPLGIFGCDPGIFQENPATHTVTDTIVQATQQIQVSDPAHTGVIDFGSSNGTSIVANFLIGLSPTFSTTGGGYGIDVPDSPALGSLRITSLTPGSDGRLPTAWSGTTNAVSYEDLNPLWTTGCDFPLTCTDLKSTAIPWGTSMDYIGPPPGAGGEPYIVQSLVCQAIATGTTRSCSFPNPVRAGDVIIASYDSDDTTHTPTQFTNNIGDTFLPVNVGFGGDYRASYAVGSNGGYPVTISTTINSGATNSLLQISEVFAGGAINGTSNFTNSCTGSNSVNFNSVTTSGQSVLIGIVIAEGVSNLGYNTFTPGSGFLMASQARLTDGGTNPSFSLAIEAGPEPSSGTWTPVMTVDQGCSASLPNSATIAFSPSITNSPADPWPRLDTYADYAQGGGFPAAVGFLFNSTSSGPGPAIAITPTGVKCYPFGGTGGTGCDTGGTGTIYLAGTDSGSSGTNYALISANLNANSNSCPAALTTGLTASIVPAHANSSTTPTFQLCALGSAATIVKNGSAGQVALVNGDMITNQVAALKYDSIEGTWELQNPSTGGGSVAFSAITTGVNSSATMTVGTGGEITVSGSGVNNANEVNGAVVPASAAVAGTNSSRQIVASTPHQVALPLQCADTSSSSTTYTCTTTPSLGSLTAGDTFIFSAINQNNSGSSTLNIDTIGAKTIKKWQNTANLAAGDLQSGAAVLLTYDGTYLEMDTIGNAPSGAASPVFKLETTTYQVLAGDFSGPSPACGHLVGTQGSTGFTITLVASGSQPASGSCVLISNLASASAGVITVAPSGQNLFNVRSGSGGGGSSNIVLQPGESAEVDSNGTDYYATIFPGAVFGSDVTFGYNTYTASQTNSVIIGANGAPTGTTGNDNTLLGAGSASSLTSGSKNTAVGYETAQSLTSGGYNIFLGYGVSFSTLATGSGNILIGSNSGYQCDTPASGTSNYLCIAGTLYGDWSKGIFGWKGSATTIASNACGSTSQGALATGSNDTVGEVTVGTAAVTSCAVSFANTHNAAPFCTVTSQAGATVVGFGYSISTTALTVTATSGFSSTKFDYHCFFGATSGNPTP